MGTEKEVIRLGYVWTVRLKFLDMIFSRKRNDLDNFCNFKNFQLAYYII
jgi:hypothetical protein